MCYAYPSINQVFTAFICVCFNYILNSFHSLFLSRRPPFISRPSSVFSVSLPLWFLYVTHLDFPFSLPSAIYSLLFYSTFLLSLSSFILFFPLFIFFSLSFFSPFSLLPRFLWECPEKICILSKKPSHSSTLKHTCELQYLKFSVKFHSNDCITFAGQHSTDKLLSWGNSTSCE